MLLQNLRARISARLSGDREAGFTLIELLVVMLILGILAAIALPAFFNQRDKAGDAEAKSYAHTAQVAMETYATENDGSYAGVEEADLEGIEPTLQEAQAIAITNTAGAGVPDADSYRVTITSTTANTFSVDNNGGVFTYPCTGGGGCPAGGEWD